MALGVVIDDLGFKAEPPNPANPEDYVDGVLRENTGKQFGQVLGVATIAPCIIAIPSFLIAGFKYRDIKLAKDKPDEV